jgi:hypothetical protein
MLRRLDPAWSKAYHDADPGETPTVTNLTLRPYALSPLYFPEAFSLTLDDWLPLEGRLVGERFLKTEREETGRRGLRHAAPTEERFLLPAGTPVSLRIALFHDTDANRLLCGLADNAATRNPRALPPLGGGFQTGGDSGKAPCLLTTLPPADLPDGVLHPDALTASWRELTDAPPAERIRLRFVTPTDFAANGRNLTNCTAQDLLENWHRSWMAAAPRDFPPPKVPEEAADFLQIVESEEDPLIRRTWRIQRSPKSGYTGSLELVWLPGASEAARRNAAALATWSNFAGTGPRTTVGMGQTRAGIPADESD